MDRQELISQLRALAQEYLKERGLDLVDIIYRYEGRDLVLRILVDKPEGGISLGECAYINQELSRILDEKDMLQARYILEVSSPGIDWPLRKKEDFLRCLSRKARFFLREAVNGKIEWEGTIVKVEGESVYVDAAGTALEIPLSKINKAKQVI
ncbi:MAG: ribosome maturation factor RimP [Candidatus Omnitrophota bacterium]|jgi:ribosome maturation factor RimP